MSTESAPKYQQINTTKKQRPQRRSTGNASLILRASLNAHNLNQLAVEDEYEPELSFTGIYEQSVASRRDLVCRDPAAYIKSYRRYVIWNGLRFFIVTGLLLGMAITRQLQLYHHYNKNMCCFCYDLAYLHQSGSDKEVTQIFEWASCEYDIKGVSRSNITSDCSWTALPDAVQHDLLKVDNLSTKHDLFGARYYYIKTASIVFIFSAIYTLYSIYRACCKTKNLKQMVRNVLYQLLYNIIVSILCFYQILINYQYYKKYMKFPGATQNTPLPPDGRNYGECYINALDYPTETLIKTIMIIATTYIFVPCFVEIILFWCRNNICIKAIKRIYTRLTFGCCGIIVFTFIGIVGYYTFTVLEHFHLNATILIISMDVLLILSFFDIVFFKIRYYARLPFKKLTGICTKITKCICCYNRFVGAIDNDPIPYRERFPSEPVVSVV